MRRNTGSSLSSGYDSGSGSGHLPSMSISRAGSALATSRSGTRRSTRNTDMASNISTTTTTSDHAPLVSQDDDSGSNIKVVVRSRGRNDREVKQKSAVVVDTSLSKTEIAVTTSPESHNSKVFSVDRVFGSEADQSMIFEEIVSPMVDDFVAGMNCTVFAYGQTGTGKTYTMSGDDSLSANYYTHEAGIIPRVLFYVFNALSLRYQDYSVSVSFSELYNEELRDLLDDDETKKVRIFDDQAKKTVVINGLNELFVTSAVEGLQILQDGLKKRQVASTKMNDTSSRSHSIFTITVCASLDELTGDYALKSKMNLVDLAGSENIGKSGAENKRAREAGMINQSLLTLGRVINALVDKSPHIPYRESKLTRLLQDSLGGRTKTCIIATVSPALVNIEETLSTLEYASRAKSIKNKPQINPLSSFKSTLKEFCSQMEKLQHDLTATRKKNGIYMDPENYKGLMDEHNSQSILVKDQQRKLDTIQAQLKTARESHESLYRDFVEVNKKLQESQNTLTETSNTLKSTQQVLATTKSALKRETALKQAYAGTEGQLQSIGGELIKSLDAAVNDTEILHTKIDRMQKFDEKNSSLVMSSVKHISDHTDALESKIVEYNDHHEQLSNTINTNFERVLHAERQKLEDAINLLRDNLTNVDILGDSMTTQQQSYEKDNTVYLSKQEAKLKSMFKQIVEGGLNEIHQMSEQLLADMVVKMEESHKSSRNDISNLLSQFQSIQAEYKNQMDAYMDALAQHKDDASQLVRTLQQQVTAKVEVFNKDLEWHNQKSEEDRQDLLSKMALLLENYSGMEKSRYAEIAKSSKQIALTDNNVYEERLSDMLSKKSLEVRETYDSLIAKEEQLKLAVEQSKITASGTGQNAQQLSQAVKDGISKNIEGLVKLAESNAVEADDFFSEMRQRSNSQTSRLLGDVRQLCRKVKLSFNSLSDQLVDLQTNGLSSTDGLAVDDGEWLAVSEESLANISVIKSTLTTLMDSMNEQRDKLLKPTGDTPKRRKFEFARVLPQTNQKLVQLSPAKQTTQKIDDDSERLPLEDLENMENPGNLRSAATKTTRSVSRMKPNSQGRQNIPLKRRGSFTTENEPASTRPRLGR